jgi:hypothetical protein
MKQNVLVTGMVKSLVRNIYISKECESTQNTAPSISLLLLQHD